MDKYFFTEYHIYFDDLINYITKDLENEKFTISEAIKNYIYYSKYDSNQSYFINMDYLEDIIAENDIKELKEDIVITYNALHNNIPSHIRYFYINF